MTAEMGGRAAPRASSGVSLYLSVHLSMVFRLSAKSRAQLGSRSPRASNPPVRDEGFLNLVPLSAISEAREVAAVILNSAPLGTI